MMIEVRAIVRKTLERAGNAPGAEVYSKGEAT
jgi:hypothetical protein